MIGRRKHRKAKVIKRRFLAKRMWSPSHARLCKRIARLLMNDGEFPKKKKMVIEKDSDRCIEWIRRNEELETSTRGRQKIDLGLQTKARSPPLFTPETWTTQTTAVSSASERFTGFERPTLFCSNVGIQRITSTHSF
jgi:hypothetical protein